MNDKGTFRAGVIEYVVTADDFSAGRLDLVSLVADRLSESQPASTLGALELIELGSVYVENERVLNPNRKMKLGDRLRVHSRPRRFAKPISLRDRITEETEDYVFVLKPAGLPLSGTVDNLAENLVSYLSEDRHQFLYPVHTLDTESEALVALAKSLHAQESAKKKFANSQVVRQMVAFTERALEVQDLTPQVRITSSETHLSPTSVFTEGAMSWLVEGNAIATWTRLEIELKNGRPADVREVLSRANAPILGDRTHGSPRTLIQAATGQASPALLTARFRI